MGILEKISEIEKEIARTQKNKGNTVRQVMYGTAMIDLVMFCHYIVNIIIIETRHYIMFLNTVNL